MKSREWPAYAKISSDAKFREQLRLTFAGVVVATAFVVPDDNPIGSFLKTWLSVSAVFASLYLIFSAARVKYVNPGMVYETFRIRERFRMRMFDWSVNIFGFSTLLFLGMLVIGGIQRIFSVQFDGIWEEVFVAIATILIAVIILLMINPHKANQERRLPEL